MRHEVWGASYSVSHADRFSRAELITIIKAMRHRTLYATAEEAKQAAAACAAKLPLRLREAMICCADKRRAPGLAPDLITAWLEVATEGGRPIAGALADLSAAVGVTRRHSWLSEVRRGVRPLPEPDRAYMLRQALPWILADAGLSEPVAGLTALAASLGPPQKATL